MYIDLCQECGFHSVYFTFHFLDSTHLQSTVGLLSKLHYGSYHLSNNSYGETSKHPRDAPFAGAARQRPLLHVGAAEEKHSALGCTLC
jgi:hypothetical protein